MYFIEHNQPHFHAEYNEFTAQISINDLQLINGALPPRVLGLVVEWASLHRDELKYNWEDGRKTGKFKKIEGLK